MSLYFARYIGETAKDLENCQRYYVRIQQGWVGRAIFVENEHFGWSLTYHNLDAFLREWDNFEQDAKIEDTVAGLVGV